MSFVFYFKKLRKYTISYLNLKLKIQRLPASEFLKKLTFKQYKTDNSNRSKETVQNKKWQR